MPFNSGPRISTFVGIAGGQCELVMAIDVPEHFADAGGRHMPAECRRVSSRLALISTRKDFIEQVVEANPFEDRRSHRAEAELQASGCARTWPNGQSWIVGAGEP